MTSRASGRGLTASTHVGLPGHDWESVIQSARRSVPEQTAVPSAPAQHLINRNYRCKRCHFYTTKSKAFLYHQKQVHGDNINIYPCDLCDYASRYKCKVLRHRKFVHAGAKDLDPADVMEESGTLQANGHTDILKQEELKQDLNQGGEHIKREDNQENLDLNGNEMVVDAEGSPEPRVALEDPVAPLAVATSNPLDNLRESPAPHGQMTFHCKLCSYSDSQKWKAVNHIKSTHMKEKLFKCPFCTFATGSKIEYCIHKTKHSTKQFSCDECSFTSISKESYDQHIASHKTEGAIKCRLCSYTSDEDSAMQTHMQEAHPLADINEMAAAYQVKLEPEDVEVDSTPPSTPPMVALAKLAAQDPLPSQASPGLSPETDVACQICGLVLKSDAKLRIHMVSHTQESAHRCPLCTLKYKRSSDLNRHMKKKHGIRLRDFMMGEQDEPLNLTTQKIMFDMEDEQPLDLSCKKKVPMVSQNGENLKCSHCTYIAKWPSDLHRHMLVHSVEKRYQCTYCHRRYKYKFDLNMHLRKMHKVPAGRVKVLPGDEALGTLQIMDSPQDLGPDDEDDQDEEDREYMSSPSPVHSPGSPMSEANSYSASSPMPSSNSITPLKPAAAEKLLKSPRQLQLGPASKFRCEYCPYYGACRSEVDRHLRLHTGEKPYSCLFCSYKSHWKGDMKRHIQKHHPEELKTEQDIIDIMTKAYQPDSAFDHIAAGQIEIKAIVGSLKPSPSPSRLSECSSDSSGAPPNMVVGANGEVLPPGVKGSNGSVDGSPKKNMCPYCPFVCEAPSKLKCHMEIHENLKRFKCPHCGKRSNWTWDVRKHIKKEHPGMDLNVIVLPEEEARTSLGDYLQQQQTRIQNSDLLRMPPSMVARRTLDFPHEYLSSAEDFHFDDDASRSAMSDYDMDDSRDMERMDYSESSSFSVYDNMPKTGRYRPYKCSKCGRRSNWKWDLRKHIRTSHPESNARMIIMSEEEARASWPPEKPINFDIEESRKVITPRPEPIPSSQQQVLQQVDTKRLKRFKCALCPYRSNYRSDIGRHTKRLHRKMPFKVIILDEEEAENTLEAYKDTFGHKKFVLSPAKNKIAARMKAAQIRYQMSAMDSDSLSQAPEMPRYDSPSHSFNNGDTDSLVNDLELPEDEVIEEEEQPQPGTSVDHEGATKVKVWKCSRCDFRDRDRQVVLNHLRTHPRTKMFRCKLCGDTSDYRNSIYRHIRNRHTTTDYSTAVEEIPINTSGNADETDGSSWHCTLCGHDADCKSAIIRHVGEEHPDHELSAAIECIPNGDDAASDVKMEVDDEVPEGVEVPDLVPRQNVGSYLGSTAAKHLACNVCPYRTNKSGLLKIHKTYHKLQPGNRFKCKYCPYYVSAMRLLHQHVRLHLQQKGQTHSSGDPGTRIPDAVEDPEQPKEDGLDLSDGSLKGSKHCCDQCPFICRNKNDFIYHKQFHRQKPSAPFKCQQCPYWVGQKRLLRQHERVHSPSYSIKINGSSFSQSSLGSPTKSDGSDFDSIEMVTLKQQIINSKITSCPITPDKFTPLDDVDDEDDDEDKMEIDETENDERITMQGFVVDGDNQLLKSGLLKKLHRCSECPYTNIRAANLKLHEAMHKERLPKENEDSFNCQFCSYNTANKKLLHQHIKVHSQQYEPGQDDIVDFVDPDKAADSVADEVTGDDQPLELTKKHEGPVTKRPEAVSGPKIESGQLPTEFYVKYNENNGEHILERVSVQKFSCDKCPYATMTCLNFERHVMLHGCKQRFTCEYCDYSVPNFQLLLQHKKLHMMPNPNLLSMQSVSNLTKLPEISADVAAAASFPTNKDDPVSTEGVHDKLSLYENSEDFVEPKKLYRCDRCPFTNTRRDNLLAHLKFHMIRSALQCSYCDYSVSKQHLLTQHMKVHFTSDGQFKSPSNSSQPLAENDAAVGDNSKPKDGAKANSDAAKTDVTENSKNGDNTASSNASDESQPEYIDLSELSTIKEDDNNNGEDSGKENQGQTEGKDGDSSCVCQYCDRTFQSAEKKQRHEMQHLVGKKY